MLLIEIAKREENTSSHDISSFVKSTSFQNSQFSNLTYIIPHIVSIVTLDFCLYLILVLERDVISFDY